MGPPTLPLGPPLENSLARAGLGTHRRPAAHLPPLRPPQDQAGPWWEGQGSRLGPFQALPTSPHTQAMGAPVPP